MIQGLAWGLSRLEDGDEEYLFLVRGQAPGWLVPFLSGRCGALPTAETPRRPGGGILRRAIRAAVPGPVIHRAWNVVQAARPVTVPASDGTIERAGIDVMHFTIQEGFRTAVPSVYVPYDLQHLHLPELFPAWQRRRREHLYRTLCAQASAVVAISEWGRQDLIRAYGLSRERVTTIHVAPATEAYGARPAASASLRGRLPLDRPFALYPAQTWRHKNHLALLDAWALLRARGLAVPLVLTGARNPYTPVVEARIRELRLGELVHLAGWIPPDGMLWLYRNARMLVFPSLFEGFGMPIVEAFREGLPVACADSASLPEVAGGAALLFDPRRAEEIAVATARVWSDETLREALARRGLERARAYSWIVAARAYRELYRRLGRGAGGPASRPTSG